MAFNRFCSHEAIRPQEFGLLYKQYTSSLLVVVYCTGFIDFLNATDGFCIDHSYSWVSRSLRL